MNKIGPIIGDGVHDTDLMLWYTQARIVSAYAQTVDVRGLKYPDLGWTMYRFDSGAVGILENIWCLPDGTPFQIDERMEIVGTEGTIHIQEASSISQFRRLRFIRLDVSRHNLLARTAWIPRGCTSRGTIVLRQLRSAR